MKKNFKTLLLVVLTVTVIGCNKSNGGGEENSLHLNLAGMKHLNTK